jgi:hypothetical protein
MIEHAVIERAVIAPEPRSSPRGDRAQAAFERAP